LSRPQIPVEVSPKLARYIEKRARWWKRHRPAASYSFKQALRKVLKMIAQLPNCGVDIPIDEIPNLQQFPVGKIEHTIYFEPMVDSATNKINRIFVHEIWSTHDSTEPPLMDS